MSTNQTTCKNCEQSFDSDFSFCPHCGQKDKDELTLSVLFYNTVSNYFSFDARFFKSFLPLIFKPGFIAREFIEGKRLQYLHPAQMYLFVAIVFFFLFSFNANKQVSEIDKEFANAFEENGTIDSLSTEANQAFIIKDSLNREEARLALKKNSIYTGMTENQIDSLVDNKNFNAKKYNFGLENSKIDSLIKLNAPDKEIYEAMGLKDDDGAFKKRLFAQALKFLRSKKGGSILQAFYDTIPIAMFFVLPLFALLLKLFYRKRGRYTHHLVFSFYFFAFIFTVFSLIVVINFIKDIPGWIDTLLVLSVFFYLVIALKRFYQQGWFKSYFKASLIAICFFPIVLIVAVFVAFFAFMFY